MANMERIEVDALICGGGMSGMSCASFAAESGAKVLVVEKQPHLGGSSKYSAGMMWAPKSIEALREWVPDGDAKLQQSWLEDYFGAIQFMRDNDIPTAEQYKPIMTIGIGYPIKIPDLYQLHLRRIKESNTGSQIMNNTRVIRLLHENANVPGSRVIGAIIQRTLSDSSGTGKYIEVRARVVVMATGGFQGSNELRSRFIGPGAEDMFVRSNVGSVGDGLRLATKAGATTSTGLSTYYGHLMASPVKREDVTPQDFLLLAQYQSRQCLLINQAGRRFADETTGDEVVNQYLTRQENRKGFLIFNNAVREKYTLSSPFPNAGNLDRLAKAKEHGCRVAEAPTLAGIIEALRPWGVDVAQTKRTVHDYHRHVALGDESVALDFPTGRGGTPAPPLVEGDGPFFAMEVQPSITFTYGGILIDSKGQALNADKQPIPGLLVAGVDAGGFSNLGYAGGLALAFVTGYWAAKQISWELNLATPSLPSPNVKDLESVGRHSTARM